MPSTAYDNQSVHIYLVALAHSDNQYMWYHEPTALADSLATTHDSHILQHLWNRFHRDTCESWWWISVAWWKKAYYIGKQAYIGSDTQCILYVYTFKMNTCMADMVNAWSKDQKWLGIFMKDESQDRRMEWSVRVSILVNAIQARAISNDKSAQRMRLVSLMAC